MLAAIVFVISPTKLWLTSEADTTVCEENIPIVCDLVPSRMADIVADSEDVGEILVLMPIVSDISSTELWCGIMVDTTVCVEENIPVSRVWVPFIMAATAVDTNAVDDWMMSEFIIDVVDKKTDDFSDELLFIAYDVDISLKYDVIDPDIVTVLALDGVESIDDKTLDSDDTISSVAVDVTAEKYDDLSVVLYILVCSVDIDDDVSIVISEPLLDIVCVSIDDEGVILSVVHETGFKYDMLKTGK